MNLEVFGNVIKRCCESFDVCLQLKLKLRRQWRKKVIKIYANQDQISKHHYNNVIIFLVELDGVIMSLMSNSDCYESYY